MKNILAIPPKMVHDQSEQCSLRKIYTKQRYDLVRMQLRSHANTKAVKRFKRYRGHAVYTVYAIKSRLLLVRESEISLHKWSVGTAHLRTVEGKLPLGVAILLLKTAAIEH